MNAAIYARKSTDDEPGRATEQKSVVRQEELARAFAAKNGWTVTHVYVDDGISGAEFKKRPGLQRLLATLRRPQFERLIVSEQKSIGREMSERAMVIKQLTMAGVEIFEYVHGKSLTPKNAIEKMVGGLQGFADEMHREQTADRVRETHTRSMQKGYVVGGRVFGYRNQDVHSGAVDAHGRPQRSHVVRVVDPAQAAVVLRIYEMYDEGYGLKRIAKLLTAEGAASPIPFIRKDATKVLPVRGWSPSTVGAVLQRELYRGVVVWNRSVKRPAHRQGEARQQARPEKEWLRLPVNEDLRIVHDDLWNRVAKRRADVEGKASRFASGRLCGGTPKHESRNLLAGLATCALCGGGLYVETAPRKRGRVPEYVCGRRRINGTCENSLRMPVAEVNEAVLQTVERHALTEEAIEQVIHFSERDDVTDLKTKMDREQKDITRRLKKLTGLIEDGAGDVAVLVARVRELEARQRELQTEATRLRPIPRLAPMVIENRLAEWRRLLRQSTTTGRTVLQRVLLGRLLFTPRRNEISGEIDGYEFEATTRFDQLFTGIAVERPANLDLHDMAGTEGIRPEDTGEADFGLLLERAYKQAEQMGGAESGSKNAGGVASPAGFEPAF
jgi:site-specific DNA recombinase